MNLIFANRSSWSDLIFFERILSKRFSIFHDNGIFVRNLKFNTSTYDNEKWIGIISFFEDNVPLIEFKRMSVISEIGFLFACQVFKESDLINVWLCQLIIFFYDLLHRFFEDLMRNTKKFTMLLSFHRCRTRSCVN